MSSENQPLPSAPIIEASVDIDCDLPPMLDLQSLREAAGDGLLAIVAVIEAEQALVTANRELITRFEQKIQAALARVWGDNK